MALAPHLRMVVWPRKFWPHLSKKYDRTVNPTKFLQIYYTSILAIEGDEAVIANYFTIALTGTTRPWLMNLILPSTGFKNRLQAEVLLLVDAGGHRCSGR
jgi:hypothetical protein